MIDELDIAVLTSDRQPSAVTAKPVDSSEWYFLTVNQPPFSPAEKKVNVSFFPAALPTDTAEELGEVTKGQPGGC